MINGGRVYKRGVEGVDGVEGVVDGGIRRVS
jgi:hypothetical protein